MRKLKLIIAALFLMLPLAANADLIRLDAVSLEPATANDFSVVFNDTGDGLLQLDEVISFSGLYSGIFGQTLDILFQTPDTAFSTFTVDPAALPFSSTTWGFQSTAAPGLSFGLGVLLFEYSLTSVPEPGTLALFSIGLLGLGLTRRKMRA